MTVWPSALRAAEAHADQAIVRPVTVLAERLAARTLELVDIPSESRDEARLAGHVLRVLRDGGVDARDLGDTCVLAGPEDAPVLLAGHLDTVPAQDNRPGRIEDGTRARARRERHEGRASR